MSKALPISENEIGVVYKLINSAFFYPLDCAYYKNVLYKEKTFNRMSFEKFKRIYPIQIHSNFYTKSKDKHTYL